MVGEFAAPGTGCAGGQRVSGRGARARKSFKGCSAGAESSCVEDWIQEKKHRVAVNAGGTLGCGLMYVGGTCLNEMFLVPAPSLFPASGVHRRSLLHLGRAD